jgi:hypothetical protein
MTRMGTTGTLAALALAGVSAVGLAAGPAQAATGRTVVCPSGPGACVVTVMVPSSGTVPVTVTVDKRGISATPYTWVLSDFGGRQCSGNYRPADPPSTKTCPARGGAVRFTTPAAEGPTVITLSWPSI